MRRALAVAALHACRHGAARQRQRERRAVERRDGEQPRQTAFELAHAPLAPRREMVRHARRELDAERRRLRVQDRHAMRPIGHAQRRAVSRAEPMHDPVRERARACGIVARQHELLRPRERARREREQRLLRRRVSVEHVHVVDDDQRGARQLGRAAGRACPRSPRWRAGAGTRPPSGAPPCASDRAAQPPPSRRARGESCRVPCPPPAGWGCTARPARRLQQRRRRRLPRCFGRR